jgi:hypothetical protein
MANTTSQTFLDRLIGEEGLKTDVQVSVKSSVYIMLAFAIAGGVVLGLVIFNAGKKLF